MITAPLPSMPVRFWNDPDGSRYREAYFDVYPGVWRHGDWIIITERGSCVITGRSDATLNRGGVRLGTSEFYSVVEALDEVVDSVVVHLDDPSGGAGDLVLFVVLSDGLELDDVLRAKIAKELRTSLSPRHVPGRDLPGEGGSPDPVGEEVGGARQEDSDRHARRRRAAAKGALANPESLEAFEALAAAAAPCGPDPW